MSLESTAARGDRLATLEALRQRLAKKIDETESGRDIAALTARLTDVLSQIEELGNAPAESEADPLGTLIALPGALG